VFYVRDANGCTLDSAVTLDGISDLSIGAVTVQNASCFGYNDGSITITPQGGTAPFRYRINGGGFQGDNKMPGLMKATYAIEIADALDCLLDTAIAVAAPEKLELKTAILSNNDCEQADDGGRIAVEVTGGTTPYQYLWNTNPPKMLADISGVGNGTYQVTVTDFNRCSDTASATIIYDNCCKVLIPDAFTPNNDGLNDKARLRYKGDIALQQFAIFNRFGQMVFRTTNANEGWDGTWNGIPQDLGTYNYYMKGICGTGGNKVVEYKGTIILIR
jgi:gliding motility-associated-like protein